MNFNKVIFSGIVALLICTTNAFAQVKKKPAPATKAKPKTAAPATQAKPNLLPVDPEVLIGKLPNGLTYYIRKNSSVKGRATALLVNKAGSLVETDAQQGAAHFIEHLAFNGTRDFPKDELQKYINARGVTLGADFSATSSFDQSIYQLALPTDTVDVFEKGFKLLAGWAGSITFDDAAIEKERAVIMEEARTGGKTLQDRLQRKTLPVVLKNSRYAVRLPQGKEDVLKTINSATLKTYYQEWYRPNLQAIIIVGDFDVNRVEKLIKDNFSPLKNPVAAKPAMAYTIATIPGVSANAVTDKELTYIQTQITTFFPPSSVKTTADYMQSMRIGLFNQMLGTRINEIVNQRSTQLLNASASYSPFIGKENSFTVVTLTRPSGLETGIKAVATELERARKFGFTVTELERAKQGALIATGNAYQGKNQTLSSEYISDYIQNFINGYPIPGIDYEYSFYTNNIGKISINEINAMAMAYITPQNRVIMLQAPESEKGNLPAEATILSWINNAGKDITAYVDETEEPFLNKLPVAGKVVNIVKDSIINTTTLTLSNGVKVVLKPTEFTNGQILFNGYSYGGASLANDQDLLSASFSDKVIPLSGVGDLSQAQLDKRLTSKRLSLSPYISEAVQGISGNSAAGDFEYAMQLLYLYFTQPRIDAAAWEDFIKQSRTAIITKGTDPLAMYQDTVTAIFNNHNPRTAPPTLEKVNAATANKALDFYKNRFADASGFTFTFVGSFDVPGITPFLETYLASLPSTNKKETYKNWAIHPQAGQITRTITKGNAETAAVQLTFSGPYNYSEAENIQLDALQEILNIKLTKRLTEAEGAFNPGAQVDYSKIPESRYGITLSFDAKPADANKLTNMVMDEINKLKQTGAEAKEIEQFTYLEAKATQSNYKQNSFWLGHLSTSLQNGDDPDRILQRIQLLSDITAQSTKDAANKFLSGTNLIKITLMPEKK